MQLENINNLINSPNSNISLSFTVTGLLASTPYYFRGYAYATISGETSILLYTDKINATLAEETITGGRLVVNRFQHSSLEILGSFVTSGKPIITEFGIFW